MVLFSTMGNTLEEEGNEFHFGHVEFEYPIGHQRRNIQYKDGGNAWSSEERTELEI